MTAPGDGGAATLGAGMGRKLAGIVGDATVATRMRLTEQTTRVGLKVFTDATNHVSDEIRGVMGPLFRAAAVHPDTPPDLARLFGKLGTERGQAWAWIAGTATGAAMGGGLINLLTNYLNPGVLPLIAAHPHGVLDPGTAAAMVRTDLDRDFDAAFDARANGINGARFRALIEQGRPQPSIDELRVMLNRGRITRGEFAVALQRLGFAQWQMDDVIALAAAEHTAPDLAAMWNRGIISAATAQTLGRRQGYSAQQMSQLLELGGEPPATDELLLAWRRGVISEAQVDRALRQGPIRFEWLPVIKALQWQPLPPAEVADAVNQGHMGLAEATKVARESGLRPADFKVVVDNAGIPPGPQEALDWVNRGILSEDGFKTAFLESRIKNKYIDLYLKSRHETMPPETVRLMYSRGAMTQAQALHRLQVRGYTAEDAAIILDGASAEKTAASRDLTVAQVRDLYADRLIGADDAAGMLGALGYSDEEAAWILELADLARTRRFVTAVVNRVKSGYIAGLLDESEAHTRLDRLGLPAAFKEDALALWDLERETVTRGLTPAQIVSAVKKLVISVDQGMARLIGQGYDAADAMVLLRIGGAITSGPAPPLPGAAT